MTELKPHMFSLMGKDIDFLYYVDRSDFVEMYHSKANTQVSRLFSENPFPGDIDDLQDLNLSFTSTDAISVENEPDNYDLECHAILLERIAEKYLIASVHTSIRITLKAGEVPSEFLKHNQKLLVSPSMNLLSLLRSNVLGVDQLFPDVTDLQNLYLQNARATDSEESTE